MQGKKDFTPRLFYQLSLERLVPDDDFYRKISSTIDFRFLYKATKTYYGTEGNESIDPVVFFKMCMVGYLNNLNSDRSLIRFCSNSLNIRLFLGYDLDEELPWHSTISRTRKLFGEEVFLSLFREVLRLCVEKGMVSGRRQAMDSAFIKANASLDSLLEKEVMDDVSAYAEELNEGSEYKVTPERKKRVEQHHAWKPRNLNYCGQLSVDTSHHVITGAMADFADKRDSQCLEKLCELTTENLRENEIAIGEILADTGYSSGAA